MKKIILCLAVVAVSFTSCSDSDSFNDPIPANPSTDVLVKKVVYNAITDDYTETVDYTYNGNKLVVGNYDDGTVETFTYTGDLITKIEFTDGAEVIYTETFAYDNDNRLIEYHSIETGYEEQETFSYNNDGTVTSVVGTGASASTRTLHYLNDDLVKIVVSGGNTYNYTYDSKNSPFRNVTGYDKIVHVTHGDHEFFGRTQNISLIRNVTNDIDYMSNTMNYDANGYPTSATSVANFDGDGPYTANVQYTY